MSSKQKTENLVKTIKVLMFLILLTPLVVIPKSYFPFIFWKIIIFRILAEVIFVVYLLLLLEDKRYLPSRSCLVWAVLGFLAVLILTTLTSLDVYQSFWSNQERMEGLMTMFHFVVLFWVLIAVFKKKENWYWFFKVSLGVSLAVSFYALLQRLNVQWSWVIFGGIERLSGTIGNPAFLAAYLIPHIFISGFLGYQARTRKGRIFYWLIVLFELLILYWTATRGAFLGMLAAVFCFLFFVFWQRTKKFLKIAALGLMIFIFVASALIYLCRDARWVKQSAGLWRITHITLRPSVVDTSTSTRLIAWGIGLRSWLQKPILGWGPENYALAFSANFDSRLFNMPGERWYDRAHNKILDLAVSSGAVGLLSYLFIFVCLFFLLFRYWLKTKRRDWLSPIFICLLVAYFLQNIFVFDTPSTYLMFFLLLGFIHTVTFVPSELSPQENASRSDSNSSLMSSRRKIFLAGFLLMMFLAMIKFNIKPAVANYNLGMAYFEKEQTDILNRFQAAMFIKTFVQTEARNEFAKKLSTSVDQMKKQKKDVSGARRWLNLSIGQMEENINNHPYMPIYYLYLGELYRALSDSGDPAAVAKALTVFQEVKDTFSLRPEGYYELGRLQFNLKQYEAAQLTYRQLIDQAPALSKAHLGLGMVLFEGGQPEEGLREMLKAKEMGYFDNYQNWDEFIYLADFYDRMGRYDEAAAAYQEYLVGAPHDMKAIATFARFYARLGELDRAEEIARTILEFKPQAAKEVEAFIQELRLSVGSRI